MTGAAELPDPRTQLTIKVYTVDLATGARRIIREETPVPAATQADSYSLGRYPLCQCPQAPDCHERERELRRGMRQ